MSKQLRLVITALIIVAVLAGAAVMLTPPGKSGDPLVLRDSKPNDIKTVSIQNSYGTFNITAQDGGFVSDDIPPASLDYEKFVNMMVYTGAVSFKQVVDQSPADLSKYGLQSPAASIDAVYNDGSELKFYIGDQERITGDYYCGVEGKKAVYLIEAQRCASYLLPKKDFVSSLVTPALEMSSPLSAVKDVAFTGGPLKDPVTLKAVTGDDPEISRLAASFGAPTHLVMGKGVYEFDQTYGIDLLNSLLGIQANNIEGYNFTPQQVADFGFTSPYMQVEFDLKNGTDAEVVHYSLKLIQKDGLWYMTCNDNGIIYEVSKPLYADIKYEKLPVRFFLSPMLMDLSKVELTVGGQAYTFEISGKTKDDKAVTCNGETLDIERFYTLYGLLTSAANDGTMYEGVEPTGEPLMTLKYYYLDSQKQPDVMALYKGDTLRDYVQINGVTEFAMRETFLARVQDALSKLRTTEPIATDW